VDKISFGSVIHASAKVGNVARAEAWMEEMLRRGITPNLVCFNTVLHACAHSGDVNRAMLWLQRISEAGIAPNKITYNSMIDAHAKSGDPAAAEMWLLQMVAKGFHPDQITFVTLLRACNGDTDSEAVSRWTYGAIVKAYAHAGNVAYVKRWLGDMMRQGFEPTFTLRDDIYRIVQNRADQKLLTSINSVLSQVKFVSNPGDNRNLGNQAYASVFSNASVLTPGPVPASRRNQNSKSSSLVTQSLDGQAHNANRCVAWPNTAGSLPQHQISQEELLARFEHLSL